MEDLLDIGEVARRAGVRPSALRYYEDQGLIAPAGRRAGRRVYDSGVLTRLGVIDVAQRSGFRIREIAELFDGVSGDVPAPDTWRRLVEGKLPEVRALARRAQDMERWLTESLECDCPSLDDCPIMDGCRPRGDGEDDDRGGT